MLSRNDIVYESTKKVSTEKFEVMVQKLHTNEMLVSVDYDTICLHQKDDTELKEFRTDTKTKQNYKTIDYGRTILLTEKGEDGQYRIWFSTTP